MKKILTFALALMMVLAMAACSNTQAPAAVKTGLGVVVSLASSKEANEETGPAAQTDVTVCAASFDDKGTILSVTFDVAQNRVAYDLDGKLTTDITVPGTTKRDAGDNYGMKTASGIGKEWYEQADALQAWMVGKNIDDVLGMSLSESTAPAEADLTSSVTVSVGGYLEALKEAYANAK